MGGGGSWQGGASSKEVLLAGGCSQQGGAPSRQAPKPRRQGCCKTLQGSRGHLPGPLFSPQSLGAPSSSSQSLHFLPPGDRWLTCVYGPKHGGWVGRLLRPRIRLGLP